MKKISDMRENYTFPGLDEKFIAKDPLILFDQWFEEAVKNNVVEPNAMTLATADKKGIPSARIVLLKNFTKQGFVFYTNYNSRKGEDLKTNPNAALVFFWDKLARQIRIEGRVKKLTASDSDSYFDSRPKGNKLGAIVSNQSEVIPSYSFLEKKYQDLKIKYKNLQIPRPRNWGGYCLLPERIEFWQGRENRLHDRLLFKKISAKSWILERLSP